MKKLRDLLPTSEGVLRAAAVLALIALPLMLWSLFDPTVWPLMLTLSVGQAIGTLSFLLFLGVVARDLAVGRKLGLRKKDNG
jgi:hypothetical protein